MFNLQRRAALQVAMLSTCGLLIGEALSQTDEALDDGLDVEKKKEFVRQANAQWQKEFERLRAEALAAEKRGEFSSVAPPQALVPFKDWDYYYLKGSGMRWTPNPGQPFKAVTVPVGFVTDLASVPQWLWSSGVRPEGAYAYAAIVHDYLYWFQERSRVESDKIFLAAMVDSKVDEKLRQRIYSAVRLAGGSAWKSNAELRKGGERRILKRVPDDFSISWEEWKKTPDVFAD